MVHRLQDATRLPPHDIERVLAGFVDERYADFFDRRSRGLAVDFQPMTFILSQGYKRGLTWRGLPLGKTCWDISIYQQLLQELEPRTIIEFGTGFGASALFFHDHCRMLGLDTAVITLDVETTDVSSKLAAEERIEFIAGDVEHLADLLPAERLRALPHPWLVIEDTHAHIPLIVGHMLPLMASGDYLCIEDIGLSAHGADLIGTALQDVRRGTLLVDTFYTDMFGRNLTCAPDAIFRKA